MGKEEGLTRKPQHTKKVSLLTLEHPELLNLHGAVEKDKLNESLCTHFISRP